MIELEALINESNNYKSFVLNNHQLNELELLLDGSYKPLNGFNSEKDYNSIISSMRLVNEKLWPLPIVLNVSESFIKQIKNDSKITLKDKEGFPLALLTIKDIWKPNLLHETESIFGTLDKSHAGVKNNLKKSPFCIGGSLKKINLPKHYDFKRYRYSPKKMKEFLMKNNWNRVLCFQTSSIIHRAEFEIILNESNASDSKILIHPSVGLKNYKNQKFFSQIKCYEKIIKKYPKGHAKLGLIPHTPLMAGYKECLMHAVIRKNYGCTDLIIDKKELMIKHDNNTISFYNYDNTQSILSNYSSEIGINVKLSDDSLIYSKIKKYQKKVNEPNPLTLNIKKIIEKNERIPSWFTFKSIMNELNKVYSPKKEQGLTVFFTGLSGSGKSTLSNGLMIKLLEEGSRKITLLDGDIIRTHLSNELGFSKKDRSMNVNRIGFVANEITKNKGIAICSPIAPFEKDRLKVRKLIEESGGFIEVFVDTPLQKCEERDPKGLYALARSNKIKKFTGISSPYEIPSNPEIVVDSSFENPQKIIIKIINKIEELGYKIRS